MQHVGLVNFVGIYLPTFVKIGYARSMRDERYYNVEAVEETVETGLTYGKTKSIHARLWPLQ